MSTAPAGQRNHTLNRAAYSLGQLIAVNQLKEETIIDLLLSAGMANGLSERECQATITSGLQAGTRNPRKAPA